MLDTTNFIAIINRNSKLGTRLNNRRRYSHKVNGDVKVTFIFLHVHLYSISRINKCKNKKKDNSEKHYFFYNNIYMYKICNTCNNMYKIILFRKKAVTSKKECLIFKSRNVLIKVENYFFS